MERDGCDIVGMTGMPEAALARELETKSGEAKEDALESCLAEAAEMERPLAFPEAEKWLQGT